MDISTVHGIGSTVLNKLKDLKDNGTKVTITIQKDGTYTVSTNPSHNLKPEEVYKLIDGGTSTVHKISLQATDTSYTITVHNNGSDHDDEKIQIKQHQN